MKEALNQLVGAYALLILTNDSLVVAQDPHGLRPLSMGMLGDSYVFSSETCAFDVIGAEALRTVEPGEMLTLDLKGKQGLRSFRFAEPARPAVCSFEYIYFARPDSDIDGINVHGARKRLGGSCTGKHRWMPMSSPACRIPARLQRLVLQRRQGFPMNWG